jgi:hypothetical protein
MQMSEFMIPPLVKWTLGMIGAAAVVHWAVKEVRRINQELDQAKARVRVTDRNVYPTLRRDPHTGEYRIR